MEKPEEEEDSEKSYDSEGVGAHSQKLEVDNESGENKKAIEYKAIAIKK